jgi:opacity protein-like surface antigen
MPGRSLASLRALRRLAARLALGAPLVAAAVPASAADWPDMSPLRGSFTVFEAAPVRWDGLIFGATFGYHSLSTDFGDGTASLVAYILRNSTVENEQHVSTWTTLPSKVSTGESWGAFLGYNFQEDELVYGFDLAYTRPSSLLSAASDSIARSVDTSDGYQNDVEVQASASLKLVDYATIRGRAGYAFGQFLPYAMLGVAVGRFDYTRSATVTASGVDTSGGGGLPYTFGPETQTDDKADQFAVGAVAGLGIDVALTPNIFLRGEWEYIFFSEINGMRPSLNTLRAGVGVRF